jgi:hypothetical protein
MKTTSKFRNLLAKLGGAAETEIFEKCSQTTQRKYINTGLALLCVTMMAMLAGLKFAWETDAPLVLKLGIGLLCGAVVFIIDYFLITNDSSKSNVGVYLRVVIGIMISSIVAFSLILSFTADNISTHLSEDSARKTEKLDREYHEAKERRYKPLEAKRLDIDNYHKTVCLPEAKNKFAGPLYQKKHAYCEKMEFEIAKEKERLDIAEQMLEQTYLEQREILKNAASISVLSKSKYVFTVLRNDTFLAIMSLCLFVIYWFFDMMVVINKITMSRKDQYADSLSLLENYNGELIAIGIRNNAIFEELVHQNKIGKIISGFEAKSEKLVHEGSLSEAKMYQRTINKVNQVPNSGSCGSLFEISVPMGFFLNNLESQMDEQTDVPKMMYDWIVENIKYDEDHSKQFYRNAKDVFNNKKGICGEMSILYMAFMRRMGYKADYCEVKIDCVGNEVSHACVKIETKDGETIYVDPAYKIYNVEHENLRLVDDSELEGNFARWNC